MYSWSFTTELVDPEPPEHSNEHPAINGYCSDLTPTISVHVTDLSGVNAGSIGLYINSYRVFHVTTPITNGFNVSYTHESGFSPGDMVECRIAAQDIFANQLDFTWYFTVLQSFNISLMNGTNLISFPLVQVNDSIASVLASISGSWNVVRFYDAADSADHWKCHATFKPPTLNDLWSLNHTMGSWLHTTENTTLTIYGLDPGTTIIPLYAGWNEVGYPSLDNGTYTVGDLRTDTGATLVEGFDPDEPYNLIQLEDFYVMRPGEGYKVKCPADAAWTVDW